MAGLFACMAVAQAAASDEAEVRKAEAGWAEAVKSRDQAKLDGILGAGLVYTHSTGIVDGKAEYLAKLKSGAQRYDGLETSDMVIHMYGDTAVVTAKIHMTGATKGVPFNDKLLYTHVWVKQGGRWLLVAHQTTKTQ